MSDIFALLHRCVARIDDLNGSLIGTGFLVGPGLLLTARHVADPGIQVRFGDESPVDVLRIEQAPDAEVDLALVTLDMSALLAASLGVDPQVGHRAYAIGHSETIAGMRPALLRVEGFNYPDRERGPELQLGDGQIVDGMSGGPLLNLQTYRVCGVLKRSRDVTTDLGGRAEGVTSIYSSFPMLQNIQSTWDGGHRAWNLAVSLTRVRRDRGSFPSPSDAVREVLRHAANVRAPGLQTLRLVELLDTPGLLVDPNCNAGKEGSESWRDSLFDTVRVMAAPSDTGQSCPVVVLASPGGGKSVAALAITSALLSEWELDQSADKPLPVYWDMRFLDPVDPHVGSKRWLVDELLRIGVAEEKARALLDAGCILPILDGLDEFVEGLGEREIDSMTRRYLFAISHVGFCRTSTYRETLARADCYADALTAEILDWNFQQREEFLQAVTSVLNKSAVISLDPLEAAQRLAALPRIASDSTVSNPLLLSMYCHLLLTRAEPPLPRGRLERAELYGHFVDGLLRRESKRGDHLADVDAARSALAELAWAMHLESHRGGEIRSAVTADSFDLIATKALAAVDSGKRRETELAIHSFIETARPPADADRLGTADTGIVRFLHKSFREYFVSDHVRSLLRGMRPDIDRIREIVECNIGQETWQFMKAWMLDMDPDHESTGEVVSCLAEAWVTYMVGLPTSGRDSSMARFARFQLAYALGHVPWRGTRDLMTSLLAGERDSLIQRSLAIGLTYVGDPSPLEAYVQDLRNEFKQIGGEGALNQQNLNSMLGYFGDQPFGQEAMDARVPNRRARQTAGGICEQLCSRLNQPSWAIDLYSLWQIVDPYLDEFADQRAVLEAVAEHWGDIVLALSTDRTVSEMPEYDRVAEVVKQQARPEEGE